MRHGTRIALAAVIVLGAPLAALAQEDAAGTTAAAQDAADELQDLIDEYEDAQAAFMEKYQGAATDEERQELFQNDYPKPDAYADRFMAFAKTHEGTTHAAKALSWVVSNVRGGSARDDAMQILVENHVEDAAMADVCRALVYDRDPKTVTLLRTLLEKNEHVEVRGLATFVLGLKIKAKLDGASDEKKAELMKEFVSLMETCQKEFTEVEFFPGYKTIAVAAEGELFEQQRLQIGMVAPDIVGEDIDGVPFKLSDYRGKVVMLDFWGHW